MTLLTTTYDPVTIKTVIEALQMIASADYRTWEELATPDEFVRWAKSRASHALTLLTDAPLVSSEMERTTQAPDSWANYDPFLLLEFIREESNFNASLVGEMLNFAISSAKQQQADSAAPTASEQIGTSDEADFEKGTWTFKMESGYRVGAGRYAIRALKSAPPAPKE